MTISSQHEPQIASSLVNGVRHSLIEDGRWESIEGRILALFPELASWLASAERDEWVSLEGHLWFFHAMHELLGDDALAALGATRLAQDVEVGRLAPLLRAWLREFRSDARQLLHVTPHAWHAVTRNAGRMVIASTEWAEAPEDGGPERNGRTGRMRFRVEGAPPLLLELHGWHVFLEGFGAELLRRSGRQGSFWVGPAGDALSLEAVWLDAE